MASKLKWKKVGHRTLKHVGPPSMVVRFGYNGNGKPKLLNGESVGELDLARLVREAEIEWSRYRAMEVRP